MVLHFNFLPLLFVLFTFCFGLDQDLEFALMDLNLALSSIKSCGNIIFGLYVNS